MNKKKLLVFMALNLFLGVINVNAACDTTQMNKLNSEAIRVNASYEVVEKELTIDDTFNFPDGLTEEQLDSYVPTETVFNIYINNLTENLYIVITNNNTKSSETYYYSDSNNGTITLEKEITSKVVNYTIKVYASDKTNCSNTVLYTSYLTTPMYNYHSESYLCEGIEDFYLCYSYLSVEPSFTNFEDLTLQYREGKINKDGEEIPEPVKPQDSNFFEYIKEHKGLTITGGIIIVVAIGGLVTVIIVKKQRSNVK